MWIIYSREIWHLSITSIYTVDDDDDDDENSSRGCFNNVWQMKMPFSRNIHHHYPSIARCCCCCCLISSCRGDYYLHIFNVSPLLMADACNSITAWCCELGDEMVMKCEMRSVEWRVQKKKCKFMSCNERKLALCGFSHSPFPLLTPSCILLITGWVICHSLPHRIIIVSLEWEEMPHINETIYKWNIIFCFRCICIHREKHERF